MQSELTPHYCPNIRKPVFQSLHFLNKGEMAELDFNPDYQEMLTRYGSDHRELPLSFTQFNCRGQHNECCSESEVFNKSTLDPNSSYFRRGIVLVMDSMPLGHIKLKGNRTFLSWRNMRDNEGKVKLIFGGLYGITTEFYRDLTRFTKDLRGKTNWDVLEVTQLKLLPQRHFFDGDCFGENLMSEKILAERKRMEDLLQSQY